MYKLLIAENNKIQIQSLMCYIEWEKYGIDEIKIAYNGEQGLELYKEFEPDIIMTDISMPVMSGLEMTEHIKNIGGSPKIIYMSCYDDNKYMQKAIELGAEAYLLKPIDRQELSETISRVVTALKNTTSGSDRRNDKYIEILRENFLYHIAYSPNMNIEYYNDIYERTGLDQFSVFAVAELQVVYRNRETDKDIYSFMSYIKDSILTDMENIYIIDGDNRVVILFFGNDTEQQFINEIHGIMGKCLSCGRENCDMMMMAGLSKPSRSFYDIPALLMQASNVLDNNLSFDDKVYLYENSSMPEEYYNVENIKSGIEKFIECFDETERQEFVCRLCTLNTAEDEKYAIEMRYASFFAAVQMYLNERRIPISNMLGNSKITINRGNMFETMEQLRIWMYNMLLGISEHMNKYTNPKAEEIVSQIIDYINSCYKTISNVDQIAQHCYISASYARKLFKDVTGKTIYEYIMLTRMDKAKQLLAHKNIPIYEIAERVGYKSRTNFVTAFKKYTGVLPSQFRSRI